MSGSGSRGRLSIIASHGMLPAEGRWGESGDCRQGPSTSPACPCPRAPPASQAPSARFAMDRRLHPAESQLARWRHRGRPKSSCIVSCSKDSSETNICRAGQGRAGRGRWRGVGGQAGRQVVGQECGTKGRAVEMVQPTPHTRMHLRVPTCLQHLHPAADSLLARAPQAVQLHPPNEDTHGGGALCRKAAVQVGLPGAKGRLGCVDGKHVVLAICSSGSSSNSSEAECEGWGQGQGGRWQLLPGRGFH